MSKGLEALKSMFLYIDDPQKRQFALQDYKIIEKELKALEIIRNKPWLVGEIVESKGDYKVYKRWCSIFRADMKYRATEEEFDLLKDILRREGNENN